MVSIELAQKLMAEALRNGGDLAEIYAEDSHSLTLGLDNEKLEQAVGGNDRGVGIRVFYGNTAAYAYTDDLSEAALLEAARAAASAAQRETQQNISLDMTKREPGVTHSISKSLDTLSIPEKGAILRHIDQTARQYDPRIIQVQARYTEHVSNVTIYNSDGVWAEDERTITGMRMMFTAKDGENLQPFTTGFGGRKGLELLDQYDLDSVIQKNAEAAIHMLDAQPIAAGEMPVVIGNGWGGVLFHEACGHCLEADFVMSGASPYANLIGERVGPDFLTAIDDGTVPNGWGSLSFDDEGTPAARNVLIEDGILKSYMWDIREARRHNHQTTGNGRRENFRYAPMPRMTNTFIDNGPHDPEEIIRSVKKGFYAKSLGGGQVQLGRGDYVFAVREGYLIEDGKLTRPIKGATLLGNGPETLKTIDLIGNDFALDPGVGMCGKGQSVRTHVGQPTVRVPKLTVGGSE